MEQLFQLIQQPIIAAFLIFIFTWILLKIIRRIIIRKIRQLTKLTKTDWDDSIVAAIQSISWPFYWIIPIYASSQMVSLHQLIQKAIDSLTLIITVFYSVRVIQVIVSKSVSTFVVKQNDSGKQTKKTVAIFLEITIKSLIWILAGILILQNLGYQVSALLGGLGVAGIAVGFALQNILEDIFAFFSLYFDRPFEVGDFIIIGQDMGTVEKIGIKSTRLKTLQGQELVVSNKELTENRVENFKRMDNRRVVFTFGVTYETPTKKLKDIPAMVETIMENIDKAELSRVHFAKLGSYSLEYEVVYKVLSNDYDVYMNVQQEVNLRLMDQFEKEKIVFAYPTQTLFVSK